MSNDLSPDEYYGRVVVLLQDIGITPDRDTVLSDRNSGLTPEQSADLFSEEY
ncbi:hypothetical protein [Sphingobacterium multivorum]|uniref:hypothetical protein n=1 Tax=Sphingobacterium multivorum TaxID=28454 RepID=UPI0028A98643|nr:hypothetical protein [Sphingobacterium multivorum]